MVKVGITGHRALPDELAKQISILLHAELAAFTPEELVGVTCLADGADMMFADEVLAAGGDIEVIVPAAEYRNDLPDECKDDFDRLIARATKVHRLDYVESTEESHMAASMQMLSDIDELLAVWDGQASRGYGGTADVVEEAHNHAIPVRVLWPEGAVRP